MKDLAPAAVQLASGSMPPLTKILYNASREVKEQAILGRLSEARQLLATGVDVKAVDGKGRTALHWVVFNSSYATKPKSLVATGQLADALISKGVDINREDAYQDTALDYLLYSNADFAAGAWREQPIPDRICSVPAFHGGKHRDEAGGREGSMRRAI